MKNFKTLVTLFLVSAFAVAASSCNNQNSSQGGEQPIVIPEVSDELDTLEGVGFDYEHAFFDDFTNGVDYNNWIISEDCWGSNRGGLTVKNLFYTDEGTILLRANGNYY